MKKYLIMLKTVLVSGMFLWAVDIRPSCSAASVTGLGVTSTGQKGVSYTFSGNLPSGFDYHITFVSTTAHIPNASSDTITSTGLRTKSGLASGASYTLTVQVRDASDTACSGKSATTTFSTVPANPNGSIRNFGVAGINGSKTNIRLSWQPPNAQNMGGPNGIDAYEIWRKDGNRCSDRGGARGYGTKIHTLELEPPNSRDPSITHTYDVTLPAEPNRYCFSIIHKVEIDGDDININTHVVDAPQRSLYIAHTREDNSVYYIAYPANNHVGNSSYREYTVTSAPTKSATINYWLPRFSNVFMTWSSAGFSDADVGFSSLTNHHFRYKYLGGNSWTSLSRNISDIQYSISGIKDVASNGGGMMFIQTRSQNAVGYSDWSTFDTTSSLELDTEDFGTH